LNFFSGVERWATALRPQTTCSFYEVQFSKTVEISNYRFAQMSNRWIVEPSVCDTSRTPTNQIPFDFDLKRFDKRRRCVVKRIQRRRCRQACWLCRQKCRLDRPELFRRWDTKWRQYENKLLRQMFIFNFHSETKVIL
jgi:hypothetical protein